MEFLAESVLGSNRYFPVNMGWCDWKHAWISCFLSEPVGQDNIYLIKFRLLSHLWNSDLLCSQDKAHSPQLCSQGCHIWAPTCFILLLSYHSPTWTLCPQIPLSCFVVLLPMLVPLSWTVSLPLRPFPLPLANSSSFRPLFTHHSPWQVFSPS